MYKTVALIPVFIAFVVHDGFRKPFKHVYLNYLQILTSVCLLATSVCNVLPAFSLIFDVMVVSAMGDILKALKYLELTLLAIVPLSLPAWKLLERVKEKRGNDEE